MSEPGEIPAKEPEKANNEDDDAEEGELVEATAVEEDKGDGAADNAVVAEIVEDKEANASEKPPDKNDTEKEEGEISPAKDAHRPPEATEKPVEAEAETKNEASVPSEKPKEDEKEAAIALLAAAPAAPADKKEEDTADNAATATPAPAPAVEAAKDIMSMKAGFKEEGDSQESEAAEKPAESSAAKEAVTEAPKKTETPEAAPIPAQKEENAEAGIVEEGEVEDGEVEEGQIEDEPKESEQKETEPIPMEEEATPKEEEKPTSKEEEKPTSEEEEKPTSEEEGKPTLKEEEKPEESSTPMKVDEPQPSESKVTSDEDGEIKEDTDEHGEIKEDNEEDGEIKEAPEVEEKVKEALKEDETMEESKESSEEKAAADETPDPYADTASTDADTASVADDKPSYSTRGRASGTATPVPRDVQPSSKSSKVTGSVGGSSEQWERSVREALEDLSRSAKDGVPAGVGTGGTSFLEALGEEERRTRTRFLPAVDGIHQLRKTEIKSDLSLARSIMSQAGNVTSVASVAGTASSSLSKKTSKTKKKLQEGEPDAMDTDDNEASTPTEDDLGSEVGFRVGNTSNIQLTSDDVLAVPSTAFIPPPAATQSVSVSAANGEKKEDGAPPAPAISTGIKEILNNQGNIKSPKVIESVSAFNPPRPPESAGKKKQHRMLRWERRPADVEVDLNNYRKTVDRTRKELHTAESELGRIENTSNHLRRHFLGHLKCMDQESDVISEELGAVQQHCVSAADLLTSRTRSRGAGKGSYVMKDVLGVLKARGTELSEKGLSLRPDFLADVAQSFPGVGGVSTASFADWDQHTVITPHRIASSWILPNDTVQTPCGEGTVLEVFKSSSLDVKEPSPGKPKPSGKSPTKMDVDQPQKAKSAPAAGDKKKAPPPSAGGLDSSQEFATMLAPRISVRLPYGVGYFSSKDVVSKECANTLTDAELVKRWRNIMETATMVAGQLDQAGMAMAESTGPNKEDAVESTDKTSEEVGSSTNGGHAPMEIDGTTNGGEKTTAGNMQSVSSSGEAKDPSKRKMLPFGSGLIPTGTGRGSHMAEMDVHTLQKGMQPALLDGKGVLGDKANEGVPEDVKKFEEQRQESYILQAKVLHLRNQLYRQRRIRALNERTFTATKEKSARVESLVAEMRTDLKSLKTRLDEELKELGIDHDAAEAILKEYYLSHDYDDAEDEDEDDGEELGQKRSRDSYANEGQVGEAAQLTEKDRQAKRTKVSSQ